MEKAIYTDTDATGVVTKVAIDGRAIIITADYGMPGMRVEKLTLTPRLLAEITIAVYRESE